MKNSLSTVVSTPKRSMKFYKENT